MRDQKLRFIIAEKEYLIAMDARESLLAAFAADVDVVSLGELRSRLGEGNWDLALIDVSADAEANRRNAGMALASGAGLVFATGHIDMAGGVPGLAEWPVVIKPFNEILLFEAVRRALALVGKA